MFQLKKKLPFIAAKKNLGHVSREHAGEVIEHLFHEKSLSPERAKLCANVFRQLNEYLLPEHNPCDAHMRLFGEDAVSKHTSAWLAKVMNGKIPVTEKIAEYVEKMCFKELKKKK